MREIEPARSSCSRPGIRIERAPSSSSSSHVGRTEQTPRSAQHHPTTSERELTAGAQAGSLPSASRTSRPGSESRASTGRWTTWSEASLGQQVRSFRSLTWTELMYASRNAVRGRTIRGELWHLRAHRVLANACAAQVNIEVPERYPFSPLKMRFITKVRRATGGADALDLTFL